MFFHLARGKQNKPKEVPSAPPVLTVLEIAIFKTSRRTFSDPHTYFPGALEVFRGYGLLDFLRNGLYSEISFGDNLPKEFGQLR